MMIWMIVVVIVNVDDDDNDDIDNDIRYIYYLMINYLPNYFVVNHDAQYDNY